MDSRDSATPFVGREAELSSLLARLDDACHGHGGATLVAGDPGIGKTALARAFAAEAKARGATVLWGRCYESEWTVPLLPWIEAISSAVREIPPDELRTLIEGDPRNSAAVLAGIVPDLAPFVPRAEGPASISTEDDRARLHDAVARFLVLLAGDGSLVVVLDDLHWADGATLELARYVAFTGVQQRLLLLGTYRDVELPQEHPLSALLPLLRREARATPVALKGLSSADIQTLIGGAAPGTWGTRLATTIESETKGNPFFIEELLRHLVAEASSTGGGDWKSGTGTNGIVIPEGVRQVVGRRLTRLSEAAQKLLTHAAVFSGGFDFAVLPPLTGLDEETLLDAVDEALAARMIEPSAAGLERYDFVHAIVRHALSETWSPSRRVRLHRKAAESLLAAFPGQEQAHAVELAVQFHRSLTLPGADAGLPFALEAANRARQTFATDAVVRMLQMARDLAATSDASTRASVLMDLAIAEADAVRGDDAVATVEQALSALEEAQTPASDIADFIADASKALKQRAYVDSRHWRPLVERGLRLTGPEHGRAWAKLMLLSEPVEPVSREAIRAGRWVGFDASAVDVARAHGDEEEFARSFESFDARSRPETEALVERARTWTRPPAVMYGLTVAANDFHYRHGAFRDAALLWEDLITLSERCGAINWQAQATNQLCWLRIAEGRFDDAREMESRANTLLDRLGPGRRSHVLAMEMATSFAVYLDGDWPALAAFWASQVDDPSLGPTDLGTLAGTLYAGLAAFAAAEAGLVDQSKRLLDTLVPILERMSPADANHNGAVSWACAAEWRIGVADHAAVLRRLAADVIAAGVGDYPQTSNQLSLARMAALLGNRDEADRAFDDAARITSEAGQAPLAAITAFEHGTVLARGGHALYPRVQELLGRAVDGFTALDMDRWRSRAEAARQDAEHRLGGKTVLPAGLTEREADVLKLVARGYSDRQISDELYISPRTVNAHLRNMLNKTAASNRTELSIWAFEQGLVTRDDTR